MLRLHSYFRSSAAYRVRIALHLKNLPYTTIPVHLLPDAGEQHAATFTDLNPQQTVPVLDGPQGPLTQSLAILEYLDEIAPAPPLLPPQPAARARVRALALLIACDVHPLNNLRVLQFLRQEAGLQQPQIDLWVRHWIDAGLGAFERLLERSPPGGRFCHGDEPGLADCCLIPQIYNARRYQCSLDRYPHIMRITALCESLDAFQRASPAAQPDVP